MTTLTEPYEEHNLDEVLHLTFNIKKIYTRVVIGGYLHVNVLPNRVSVYVKATKEFSAPFVRKPTPDEMEEVCRCMDEIPQGGVSFGEFGVHIWEKKE